MPMNVGLQKSKVKEALERNGIDPDTIDIEAELDSNLTLEENLKRLSEKVGRPLTKAHDPKRQKDEDFVEETAKYYVEEVGDEMEEEDWAKEIKEDKELEELETMEDSLRQEYYDHKRQLNEYFAELVRKTDPLEYFAPTVCPELAGYGEVKKAILLMLATDYDRSGQRDRIHMLLAGKPGTGKTMINQWLKREFNAEYLTMDTTPASLKADARKKDKGVQIFARNNGGIVAFDEIGLLKDIESLRDVAEEGFYVVTKGGEKESHMAQCRIIGGTNEPRKLSPAMINRFDFCFEFKEPSKDESKEIARRITRLQAGELETKTDVLKMYIDWIKDKQPEFTGNIESYDKVFDSYFELKNAGDVGRWIASVYRIARAYAKLFKRDMVPEDLVTALKMKDDMLTESQANYLRGVVNNYF